MALLFLPYMSCVSLLRFAHLFGWIFLPLLSVSFLMGQPSLDHIFLHIGLLQSVKLSSDLIIYYNFPVTSQAVLLVLTMCLLCQNLRHLLCQWHKLSEAPVAVQTVVL